VIRARLRVDTILWRGIVVSPIIPQDFPSCHNFSVFGPQSNSWPSPGSIFNPRHKANRAIFNADEILARHTPYVSLIKESMPDG
jgi:hypothetical protein